MPSLSERLKSMGIHVGAKNMAPPFNRGDQGEMHPASTSGDRAGIESVVPGRLVDTASGAAYLVETFYPADYHHGAQELSLTASRQVLSRWAGEAGVRDCLPDGLVFLDTETTGLAGGAGTYAFLVGAGRFDANGFTLAQFFMRDPTEEPALLQALESFLASCQALVTFNGKSFDVPLLNTRYTLQGWPSPLKNVAQVDLLHLARRLWRDRLPSRTLGSLEAQILGLHRSGEDTPGWMIPQMYFDYLRSGDAGPMKNVIYHNAMDVLSLASLLNHTTQMLENPTEVNNALELAALARLFEDLDDEDRAIQLYQQSLAGNQPEANYWDTLERLSFLHKRRGEIEQASRLWHQAARQELIYAHVELAKGYEHILQDDALALQWTNAALEIVRRPSYPVYERAQWLPELEHRQQRLLRRLAPYDDPPSRN